MICRAVGNPDPYAPSWRLLHRWTSWVQGKRYQQRRCLSCRKVQRKEVPG